MNLFRRLLAAIVIVVCGLACGPAFSASLVQNVTSNDNSVSSLAYTTNVSANNLGIACIRGATGVTTTSLTSSRGTWTKIGTTFSTSAGDGMLFWTQFTSSGADTVNLNSDVARIDIQEVTGLSGTISVDSTNRATSTSTSPASGTISPAVNAWIFSCLITNAYPGIGGVTAGSGFTGFDFSQDLKYFMEYQNSASGGTYNGNWTLSVSDQWYSVVAAFKGTASSTVVNPINGKGGAAAAPVTFNRRAANDDQFILRASR